MTMWKVRLASTVSSTTSSIVVGKRGTSSTEIIWSGVFSLLASSMAVLRAFAAPSEPSFAMRIFRNMSVLLADNGLARGFGCDRFVPRLKPPLGDERRHNGTPDYSGDENRILPLVDDVVCEPEQR